MFHVKHEPQAHLQCQAPSSKRMIPPPTETGGPGSASFTKPQSRPSAPVLARPTPLRLEAQVVGASLAHANHAPDHAQTNAEVPAATFVGTPSAQPMQWLFRA